MKLPVFTAFFAGLAFLAAHFLTLIRIVWLPLLFMGAVTTYLTPSLLDAQMAVAASAEAGENPAAAFGLVGKMMQTSGLLYIAAAIFYPMMIAGVLRHVVRGEAPKLPFYLRYGGDELRILGACALLIIMSILISIVAALGALVLAFAGSAIGGAAGGIIAAVLPMVFVFGIFWFALRMSVLFPASVGTRTIGLAQSWSLTAGNVWRLLFYWILWMLVLLVVGLAYFMVAGSGQIALFGELFAAGADEAAQAEVNRKMLELQRAQWDVSSPGFWPFAAATYVYMLIQTIAGNVAGGVAYRYLAGEARGA